MRTPDNRKGAVFSIRLTDDDRATLLRAAALEEIQQYGRPRALGELVRASALAVARRLLCLPLPKPDPYESYYGRFEDKLALELAKSLSVRPPPKKSPAAAGTTRRRRRRPTRASRTVVPARSRARGAR